MVHPISDLTPEYMERLEQITDAVRLWAVLYAAPAVPAPVRGRRTRQYPGGRPNSPRAVRPHRSRRR
ncbi:hypothetical protein [Streptomyces cinereoruber]|uniref:Uncharacterized protein n=1 Tax=Streptomyces cinereoruber TaxID=67260 RepID=A0ABX6BRH9_9ACTN|nr:hypothetical protein [Streptomyces cinereoruber]MBB4162417.1 hypothetical protein [Streptomyces cinereoruber]MBY8820512.1 hypothetical protein [Streptomyces cinereoruber]NIH63950.1 hypothetical protein [Streptomyces cinereoruber]QEV36511.1 hypothetical protein CP977_33715 [Streptomyces cinereoruber]